MLKNYMMLLTIVLLFVSPIYALTGHTGSQTSYIPAVMQTEMGLKGVLATVTVEVKEGSGHVYVDTLPLTEIDTQSSARLAKEVSENLLGIDMEKYDLFYTIRSNAPIIGGPSAGGAITAITLATLLNLSVDKNVVMTGTINPDGSIGPIGGVLEKVQAVAENGGHTFLIPEGQSIVNQQKAERTIAGTVIQIVTYTEPIDVRDYAKKEWNMDVVEISNVKDAIKYMTGYEIKSYAAKPLQKNETVDEIMKNMAEQFIDDVEKRYGDIKDSFDKTSISLQYKEDLESILNEQKSNIEKAKQLFGDGKYYSASSKAFYVGIQLSYVKNMLDVLLSNVISNAVTNVIKRAEDTIDLEEQIINTSVINSVTDIEIISAADERLNEAKGNIEDARKLYYNMKYADAVYTASYAMERANSAVMWYNLINNFNDTDFVFNYTSLRELAQRRIEDADSAIIYAEAIGIDAGGATTFVEKAKVNLNEGMYTSALSNAIMAKANANLLMEVRGLANLTTKISSYDKAALNAIGEAQNAGAVPILALSYYEFADSFNEDKDVATKLIYLKYAKEFASLSLELMQPAGKTSPVTVDVVPAANASAIMLVIGGFFIGVFFTFFVLRAGRWL